MLSTFLHYVRRSQRWAKVYGLLDFWPINSRRLSWQKIDPERSHHFHQRILGRMLHDRSPVLIEMEDKYRARSYVENRGGCKLPQLYWWSTALPVRLPWEKLPERYVIKTNHWSGAALYIVNNSATPLAGIDRDMTIIENYTFLVRGRDQYGRRWPANRIERSLSRLLKRGYPRWMEWALQHIVPRGVLVEELLVEKDGSLPSDYKMHCFHGKVGFVQVDFDRFAVHKQNIYRTDGSLIEQSNPRVPGHPGVTDLGSMLSQKELGALMRVAERLSHDIDYIRVDLFLLDCQVYFGEFTAYHQSGHPQSREWEELGGKLWGGDVQTLRALVH